MQARALLNGRSACTQEDLRVLRLMTRFRIPVHVHEQILEIIARVLQDPEIPRMGGGKGSGADVGVAKKGNADTVAVSEEGGTETVQKHEDPLNDFIDFGE